MREQRGLRQSQLARAAGMTQSAVARFEAGGAIPTLPVLDRLAGVLDADLIVQLELRDQAGGDQGGGDQESRRTGPDRA